MDSDGDGVYAGVVLPEMVGNRHFNTKKMTQFTRKTTGVEVVETFKERVRGKTSMGAYLVS